MASIVLIGADVIEKHLENTLQMTIKEIADEVEKTAKSKTPIRTGYTRSKWEKKVKKTDFEVSNRVPWIERLEAGASKQAPRGIIGPTIKEVKGKIR